MKVSSYFQQPQTRTKKIKCEKNFTEKGHLRLKLTRINLFLKKSVVGASLLKGFSCLYLGQKQKIYEINKKVSFLS